MVRQIHFADCAGCPDDPILLPASGLSSDPCAKREG
jgi:hypothetical protein